MKKIGLAIMSIALLNIGLLKADIVTVSGRKILVNGNHYVIKGICYNPVPVGSDTRNFSSIDDDLNLMVEAGINTLRVYSPITEKEVLDKIDAAGLKVIVSFGYNQGGNYDILSGTFIDYVNLFKNHDAILLWELGNEYNYHPEWFGNNIQNWYTALNNAAIDIHAEDPDHPVATAHGELPDGNARSSCPDVDVWGINVYRWDNPGSIFSEWRAVSNLPMYLSETGADSYMKTTQNGYEAGENEQMQADATSNILEDVFNNQDICSGVTLFAWIDEWWKAGNNGVQDIGGWAPNSSGVPYDGAPNEEFWGIVKIDRTKKLSYDVVKSKYNAVVVNVENISVTPRLYIYPNPVKDQLVIHGIDNNYRRIEIIDVTGRVFYTGEVTQDLNFQFLTRGIYYVKIDISDSIRFIPFVKL